MYDSIHYKASNPARIFDSTSLVAAFRTPAIAARMPDGTVYAGISPDTDRPMYTTPEDSAVSITWRGAIDFAATLNAHGHEDWRVPTAGELAVLFKNRAAIGSFSETNHITLGWYWSSTQADTYCRWVHCRWIHRFRDGRQSNGSENFSASLRCVRG